MSRLPPSITGLQALPEPSWWPDQIAHAERLLAMRVDASSSDLWLAHRQLAEAVARLIAELKLSDSDIRVLMQRQVVFAAPVGSSTRLGQP